MPDTTIRDAVEKLRSFFSKQPDKARASPSPATARLVDRLRCEVSGPGGERISTDMPAVMGGGASAPNPGWLMRSALASCSASAIAIRASTLGISLDFLEVTVDSESDNRGWLGLDEQITAGSTAMRTRVKIGAEGATQEQLQELVTWADLHSPVACTVRKSPAYSLEIEVMKTVTG